MRFMRILAVWGVIAGLMIVNGALRVAVLIPFFGREAGEKMSVFLGIIIVMGASRPYLLREPRLSANQALRVSAIWLVLTVAFEIGLGLLSGLEWADIGQAYAVWNGALWPAVLAAVAIAPYIWLHRHPLPIARVTK